MRAVVAIAIGALVAGCSSSSSSAAPDGAAPADLGDDAGTFDSGPLAACPILNDWAQACAASDPCASLVASRCAAVDAQMSDAARFAVATCYAYGASSCAADGGSSIDLVDSCFAQQMAAATPTAAQAKLANDVCAACAPGDGSCAAAFYATDGASDAAVAGLGAAYLMMSDAIVGRIDAACAGGADAGDAGSCAERFDACATAIYAPTFPSLECASGDGGGP